MADKSNLLWTRSIGHGGVVNKGATWNIVTGCSKESPGCKHCYAERDWEKLSMKEGSVYFGRKFTDVMCHPERLDQPLRWTRPRKIFVNSTADLFHDDVPVEFIDQTFAVMALCHAIGREHVFQVLTKRAGRMFEYLSDPEVLARIARAVKLLGPKDGLPGENAAPTWPLQNVWLGVTVESQDAAALRVPLLLTTPAAVRWVSAEPLLGEVDLSLALAPNEIDGCLLPALDWVVCGGESGDKARPLDIRWVRSLRDQCKAAGVPFLFKQWGTWAPATYVAMAGKPGTAIWNLEDASILIPNWGEPHDFGDGFGAVYAGRLDTGRLLDGELLEAYPLRVAA